MMASLKILATPLGNVRDISVRAMDELKKADVIFAEDTRHSLNLIVALGIELKPSCRLVSCYAQNEKQRIEPVIERLLANERVVFMSDAGCPTISDPGSFLVEGVVKHGFRVEIIPGPSAHTAALMGAGLDTARFAFLGFLPKRKTTRKNLILSAANADLALVFYESPVRVNDLLKELYDLLGERRVVVARELTKIYETFHRGLLGSAALNPPFIEKGECVVVVEAKKSAPLCSTSDQEDITNFIKKAKSRGDSAKDIAKAIALHFNLKKKEAYALVLKTLF